jgi:nitrite reductase/ring-hydroxylating ferredoxin subunit/uncharacterized membrane protein
VATAIVIGFGVLAALAAIATGLLEFMDIDLADPANKPKLKQHPALALAATHGVVNIVSTLLYAVSLLLRWQSNWAITWTNVIPALLGYLLITIGGFLGGSLVYRWGTMVNRNAYRILPRIFPARAVVKFSELKENAPHRVELNGDPVVLVRQGDTVHALGAVCSHFGGPLERGHIKDGTIVCPLHYSRFALKDGSVREGPTTAPLPVYQVSISDGEVIVEARN